jgi:hypothetical protein
MVPGEKSKLIDLALQPGLIKEDHNEGSYHYTCLTLAVVPDDVPLVEAPVVTEPANPHTLSFQPPDGWDENIPPSDTSSHNAVEIKGLFGMLTKSA